MPQGSDQGNVIPTALVALGSNLSNQPSEPPSSVVRQAIKALAQRIGPVTGTSRLYETPCFPAGAGPDYVNAAVALHTDLCATDLLAQLHAIEADFGRERRERWGIRTLDLDLLAFGATVWPDPATQTHWRELPACEQGALAPDGLILPHPRLQDRAFVLVPLAEVAPDWVHPLTGQSVARMLRALPVAEVAAVRRGRLPDPEQDP